MRVLDLDLDFFLSDVPYWQNDDERVNPEHYAPWNEQEVINFLETQVGLSKSTPLPGKVLVDHDEAFYEWRDKIERGELKTPFEVVHVDSHADLGMGDASYEYIMTKHLGEPISERSHPPIREWSGLGPGNYLVFAIACRWISKLTYVHNPRSSDDLTICHMKDHDKNSGFIQLKYYGQADIETLIEGKQKPLALEPEVPFEMVSAEKYKNRKPFDRIYLAQSPPYTPEASDKLIPIIKRYMISV
jgi:hypothetical protein